jgi:hypothetical protein
VALPVRKFKKQKAMYLFTVWAPAEGVDAALVAVLLAQLPSLLPRRPVVDEPPLVRRHRHELGPVRRVADAVDEVGVIPVSDHRQSGWRTKEVNKISHRAAEKQRTTTTVLIVKLPGPLSTLDRRMGPKT